MNGGPAVAEGYGGQATEMPVAGNRKTESSLVFPEFPRIPPNSPNSVLPWSLPSGRMGC